MKKIIISREEIEKGISTTVLENDGGVGIETIGMNLFRDKFCDFLLPTESGTALAESPPLDNDMLASVKNDSLLAGAEFFMVDAGGLHKKLDVTTISNVYDDSANASDYSRGYVNQIHFKGSFFTTKKDDIIKADSNYSTVLPTWWSTLVGATLDPYPHDLEVVEDILYISDRGSIHIWDGSNAQADAFTLGNFRVITSLVKHPNGRDLIVFAQGGGLNTSQSAKSYVYYIDLLTLEFYSEQLIDFRVDVARYVNGTIFVAGNLQGDDNYWGYFDGTRIVKIETANIQEGRFSKANFAKMGDFMMLPTNQEDSPDVLLYGKVKGNNVFFKPWGITGDREMILMTEYSPLTLLLIYSSSTGYTGRLIDFTKTVTADLNSTNLISNRYPQGSKAWVRRVDVYFEEPIIDGVNTNLVIRDFSQGDGVENVIGSVNYDNDGAIKYKRVDCNVFTDDFDFTTAHESSTAVKIKRVEIYVESEE